MGMLKLKNQWLSKTKAQREQVKSTATKFVQDKAIKILKEALRVSPQYSGDYAFNWFLETNQIEAGYDRRFKGKPWNQVTMRQQGDKRAINENLRVNMELIRQIKWNNKIRLVNKSPTAELLDAGAVKLRPENLIEAPQGVLAYLKMKYPHE